MKNELMIGCYVTHKNYDSEYLTAFEVTEIGETMQIDDNGVKHYFFHEDLAPIKLTDEIIAMLGYVPSAFDQAGETEPSFERRVDNAWDLITKRKDEKGEYYYFNRRNNYYLHELQCMCYWLNGFMPKFKKIKPEWRR